LKYLLDTHLLIWTAAGDEGKVPLRVRGYMDQSLCFVSAVSGYEIANKYRLGKLPEATVMMQDFEGWVRRLGFVLLPLTTAHAVRGLFEGEHRDPFDRLLAAQAEREGLVLLSSDEKLDGFGVKRVW